MAAQLTLMKGLVLAARVLVQGAGDELLAGAALAGDQHRGRGVGDALEDGVHVDDRLALADDPEAGRPLARGGGRHGDLPRGVGVGEVPRAQGLLDDDPHFVLIEGLGDEIEGARLQRLDGDVHRAVGRHHHHGAGGVVAQRGAEQLHPVDLGHAQIGDHQVDVVLFEEGQGRLAVFCGVNVVAVAAELSDEHLAQVRFVVDDEDLLFLGGHHDRRA